MGVKAVFTLLDKSMTKCHIRRFSGCTVAIDGYLYLHKGVQTCPTQVALGQDTFRYVSYCMNLIQLLLNNNIKPVVVLDGRDLPSKEETSRKRREKRAEIKELGRKCLEQGDKKGAEKHFRKCLNITHAMVRKFIKALRLKQIDYVIAPYEADAQMAYFANNGFVDCVITDDSDLILFGCPRIFFKMDRYGDGVLFENEKLPLCMNLSPSNFKFEHFRWMCILSGCDYLENLPNIGMGSARTIAFRDSNTDIKEMLEKLPDVLLRFHTHMPDGYAEGFIQAEYTYLFQLVYDTRKRTVLPLTQYPPHISPKDVTYAGLYENDQMYFEMAVGNIETKTLQVVDTFTDPIQAGYGPSSIWWIGPRPVHGNEGVFDTRPDSGMRSNPPVIRKPWQRGRGGTRKHGQQNKDTCVEPGVTHESIEKASSSSLQHNTHSTLTDQFSEMNLQQDSSSSRPYCKSRGRGRGWRMKPPTQSS